MSKKLNHRDNMVFKLCVFLIAATFSIPNVCGATKSSKTDSFKHRCTKSFYWHMAKSEDDTRIEGTLKKELDNILKLLCADSELYCLIDHSKIYQKGYLAGSSAYIVFYKSISFSISLVLDEMNPDFWKIVHCSYFSPKTGEHPTTIYQYNIPQKKITNTQHGQCPIHPRRPLSLKK